MYTSILQPKPLPEKMDLIVRSVEMDILGGKGLVCSSKHALFEHAPSPRTLFSYHVAHLGVKDSTLDIKPGNSVPDSRHAK